MKQLESDIVTSLPAALRAESQTNKGIWQRNTRRQFVAENGFSMAANYETAGQQKRILERDGYKCVDCGMTDEEHKEKWNPPTTIDQADKNRQNNSDNNLKTRCLT